MAEITGTPGGDTITPDFVSPGVSGGSPGNSGDTLVGLAGNDTLLGGNGEDLLDGGTDDDRIGAGQGLDTLVGATGNDVLVDDLSSTGDQGGVFIGGYIAGGGIADDNELDVVFGGDQSDTVYGGRGDIVLGGDQSDLLYVPDDFTDSGADSLISTERGDLTLDVWTNADGDSIFAGGFEDFDTYAPSEVAPCFVAGTRIATSRGEVAVEDLRIGDLVPSVDADGARLTPIRWIGRRRLAARRSPNWAEQAPILIRSGALGVNTPARDLRVSPDHGVYVGGGYLVPARLLVNDTTILREVWRREVTYLHVELTRHALVISDGALTESYLDCDNRNQFANARFASIVADFSGLRAPASVSATCYPVLAEDAPELPAIRSRIAGRAGSIPRPVVTLSAQAAGF